MCLTLPAASLGPYSQRSLRIGSAEDPFLAFVERFNALEEIVDDVGIRHGFARRVDGLVAPLHPAAAVGEAALLFIGGRAGQHEDFGLDLLGIHARPAPERGGFVVEEIDVHQPVQLGQGLAAFVGSWRRCTRDSGPRRRSP